MNWKITILGGLAFYLIAFAIGMFVFGPLVHEGVLAQVYDSTASFWRPELNADPPNVEALMPMWIATGMAMAFIYAGVYSIFRSSLSGCPYGVLKGLKFGVILALIHIITLLSLAGVFNLPMEIWHWWMVEGVTNIVIGSAVMGFVAQKLVPEEN